ncbi:hypothetical protein ACVNP0_09575 [Staphylococcus aureus]
METFKNWKKKPGKPLDVQLDELADMLAFGLEYCESSRSVIRRDKKKRLNQVLKIQNFTKCLILKIKNLLKTQLLVHHR